MAFEKYIFQSFGEPGISVHFLRAIVGEYVAGYATKNEVLDAIEENLTASNSGVPVVLTSDEKADLQAWMIAIDDEPKPEQKRNVADETYRVLIVAVEDGVTLYNSKAKLKARLSWI